MVKNYICPRCEKEFATRQSLWNHKQRCQGQSAPRKRIVDDSYAEPKTYRDTTAVKRPIKSYYESKPKKNPKIQNLLDEVINDDPDVTPQAIL